MTGEMVMDRRYGDIRPVPDPTTLTTEALKREMGVIQDKHRAAIELFDEKVSKERELRTKDIEALQRELVLIDKQRIESKKSDADALAAALSAAKEAVSQNTANFEKSITKTENATNELIKSLGETLNTAIASVIGTITDAKERINKVEQLVGAHMAAQTGQELGGDRREKNESDKIAWGFAAFSSIGLAVSIIIQVAK